MNTQHGGNPCPLRRDRSLGNSTAGPVLPFPRLAGDFIFASEADLRERAVQGGCASPRGIYDPSTRQVQRLLAAKHQRGRKVSDLLIAAAAEANGLTVLHYDADFDRISAVTGQRCEWVVPAGSID